MRREVIQGDNGPVIFLVPETEEEKRELMRRTDLGMCGIGPQNDPDEDVEGDDYFSNE